MAVESLSLFWITASLILLGLPFFRRFLAELPGEITRPGPLWGIYLLDQLAPFLLAKRETPLLSQEGLGELALMVAYISVPAVIQFMRKPGAPPLDKWDLFTLLFLWWPVEWGALPTATALGLPIPTLIGATNALLLFSWLRPEPPLRDHPGMGYSFSLTGKDFLISGLGLLGFAAVGVPLSLVTGFASLNPQGGVEFWVTTYLITFLYVALPEEIFFRGILQCKLARRFRHGGIALAVVALSFGLTHSNNPTAGFPVPNWHYAGMAALAGLAYGLVWWKTGRVTAAALTHAAVNTLWKGLFSG